MRIRSFIIAYALVLAILLFADRRPNPATQQDRYSHVVDLTGQNASGHGPNANSSTQIIAPDTLIPGTWTAAQIPPERLIAPMVVMDLNVAPPTQISLDDIAAWETQHGVVPQGAVVAIRHSSGFSQSPSMATLPITDDAAQFLMDARYTIGFAVDTSADLNADRLLARQLALHGSYVVERTARLDSIPPTGSLIIVAPAKDKPPRSSSLRVLAMVK